MEILNRHSAPSVFGADQSNSLGTVRGYLFRHFFFFLCSYLACGFVFYCVFNGTSETIASFTAETRLWVMLTAHGVGVWFVHACVAKLNASVWRSGPYLNAVVGAVAFMACALAFRLTVDHGPNSIVVPLSWTSGYVRFAICITGSVVAVAVLAKMTPSLATVRLQEAEA